MTNNSLQSAFRKSGRHETCEPQELITAEQEQLNLSLDPSGRCDRPAHDMIQDIQQQYEERFHRQDEQYQRVIKELDAFSYSIAHDLRAPLRAVASLVERLADQHAGNTHPEIVHTMGAIKESTAKMQDLIENLLQFSKTNCVQQDVAETDMTSLVRSVLDELLQADAGASLTVFVEPLHPAHGDTAMLRQVWINLISNAIKYTRTKPTRQIKITSRISGEEVVYRISDNGVGFSMKYADRLFGVFQRLHCSEEFEGCGVGLAIVQRIIHKHGGRVWAEGVEDNGATFYFALPTIPISRRSTRN